MPVYEVELLGRKFDVEAPNIGQAQGMARLYVAKKQMDEVTTARAMQTRTGVEADERRQAFEDLERRANSGDVAAIEERRQRERNLEMQMRATEPGAAGTAMALTAGIPLAGGLVTAPVATGKALLGGLAGAAAGKEAGEWVGRRLPLVGGATAASVLGAIGSLAGGGTGAAVAPKIAGRKLLQVATGGRFGALMGAAEGKAEAAVISPAAEKRLELMTQRAVTAAKDAESRRIKALAYDRRVTLAENKASAAAAKLARAQATAGGQPAAVAPAPFTQGATALAPESQPAAQADEIAAQILRWKNEHKFSGAQIESALRNVYGISPKDGRKLVQAVTEAQAQSPLQAPRIQIGAQRVGRPLGMTKEQVRMEAGPVLDETRGEASPILPRQALQSIIDTMKAMPMAEREAYVARAMSGKAKWQIENIRRTLEHLGLLLPAGAVAVTAER